jgi:preprotein translocase subunit SecA
VENAQRQVEQRDYKSRKQVLDFDDVMNRQREIIYTYRNEVLTTEDTRGMVHEMVGDAVLARVQEHFPDNNPLLQWIQTTLPVSISAADLIGQDPQSVTAHVVDKVLAAYASRTAGLPREALSQGERRMLLIAIDQHWQEHLTDLDELREGVYLRAQGQKDPLVEYKNEGFELFSTLMDSIKQDALKNLFRSAASIEAFLAQFHGELPEEGMLKLNLPANKPTRPPRTPGRNAACTCGSGKKFKQCCGRFG